jgi:hypothetical protein
LRGPFPAEEIERFLDTFLYEREAVLVDEILSLDHEAKRIEARISAAEPMAVSRHQRVSPQHPAHISGAEMIMATGALGGLHAWFFHGCRWDEGWSGFGNRIHRADFKRLAPIGIPLHLTSVQTRTRVGPKRVVMRLHFEFRQEEHLVYVGDQSAIFIKGDHPLAPRS